MCTIYKPNYYYTIRLEILNSKENIWFHKYLLSGTITKLRTQRRSLSEPKLKLFTH